MLYEAIAWIYIEIDPSIEVNGKSICVSKSTYSYKKINHKKYVEGKVDLLCDVAAPFLAAFHAVTEIMQSHISVKYL